MESISSNKIDTHTHKCTKCSLCRHAKPLGESVHRALSGPMNNAECLKEPVRYCVLRYQEATARKRDRLGGGGGDIKLDTGVFKKKKKKDTIHSLIWMHCISSTSVIPHPPPPIQFRIVVITAKSTSSQLDWPCRRYFIVLLNSSYFKSNGYSGCLVSQYRMTVK